MLAGGSVWPGFHPMQSQYCMGVAIMYVDDTSLWQAIAAQERARYVRLRHPVFLPDVQLPSQLAEAAAWACYPLVGEFIFAQERSSCQMS